MNKRKAEVKMRLKDYEKLALESSDAIILKEWLNSCFSIDESESWENGSKLKISKTKVEDVMKGLAYNRSVPEDFEIVVEWI